MSTLESGLYVSILVVVIASLWIWKRSYAKISQFDPPVPPGSFGLPFLGETLHYLQAMRSNKPWEFFQIREKKYGPLFVTSVFGIPTVSVNPPQGYKFLFSNHTKLLVLTWPGAMKTLVGEDSLFFMEGDKAKNFRHILMGFLGPDAMQRYVEKASEIIQKHVEECWCGKDEVKAYELVKKALFSVVFNLFLSMNDEEDQKELLDPFLRVIRGAVNFPINFPGTPFYKAKAGRVKIMQVLEKCIKRRRLDLDQGKASDQQDLLSVLITKKGENGENMTNDEIKDNILMLLLAGHDTSASSLVVAMKCIAENPWCYEELRQEHLDILASKPEGEPLVYNDIKKMKFTWKIFHEAMRITAPIQGGIRTAIKDFVMDGYTIPKGWQLWWSPFRIHGRNDLFQDADTFNPRRFDDASKVIPYSYVPFGGGPRICPGMEMAKLQDCLFIHHLVTRFKWSLVDPTETIEMAPLAAPAKGLPVKLTGNPM